MELLFDNVKDHTIQLQAQNAAENRTTNLKDLIFHIRDNMMTEKKELFVDKDTV